MTDLRATFEKAVNPALALLPSRMDSPKARVMLAAISLQEARLIHRRQIGGPARGLWQFERGGVRGVLNHATSRPHLLAFCKALKVDPTVDEIHEMLELDDVLAAGVARLLLYTDPKPLPAIGDVDAAWQTYIWNWRPGKPHRKTWDALYVQAREIARA